MGTAKKLLAEMYQCERNVGTFCNNVKLWNNSRDLGVKLKLPFLRLKSLRTKSMLLTVLDIDLARYPANNFAGYRIFGLKFLV